MFRPVLVVVCLVTLTHHVQLGKSQADIARIAAAVYEALRPELQDIRNELNCLKEAVSELNETVATLAEESEEHKNEMTTYHTETETKLEDLQTSLQFVIDNQPIEAISTGVLLLLLPYLNDIEHDIKTELGQLVVSQSGEVKECINQTALELAVLQSSSHNALDNKLALAHNNITQEIYTMIDPINATLISVSTDLSCVKTDLSRVSDAVSDLSGDLEEHSSQTSREIQSSLQQLCVKTDTLQSTLDSVDIRMIQGFALLDCATSSELTSHDTKLDSLSTQITGDFNDVRTQLSSVSNEISDKIEDHERHMESELDDLERTLSNELNQGFTSLDCATGSELTLHDTKLISLCTHITSDFNGVRTDLNSISDRIEDHDHKTANKLIDIVCLHQNPNGSCYTCGGTGGWRRAVYLDMTDPYTNCPPGWSETDYSKRTCGRATDARYICDSAYFPVSEGEYSQVCGKIRAYPWGWTPGFYGNYAGHSSINDAYFSGVAVMHGSPREHIWTFAAGGAEGDERSHYSHCPCDTSGNIAVPPFVGGDYFCESGYVWPGGSFTSNMVYTYVFHSDDPLWDGDGCISTSTCCSLNNPPYFTKTLATPTTDDLELRLCCYQSSLYEDVAVELIELYVR